MDFTLNRTWPIFYDCIPVYKIWIQYTNLFKRYLTETIFCMYRWDIRTDILMNVYFCLCVSTKYPCGSKNDTQVLRRWFSTHKSVNLRVYSIHSPLRMGNKYRQRWYYIPSPHPLWKRQKHKKNCIVTICFKMGIGPLGIISSINYNNNNNNGRFLIPANLDFHISYK